MATTKKCRTGKKMYRDLAQAKKVITSARAKVKDGYQETTYIPQRAYKCPTCHRWHLTSEANMTPFPYDARRLVVRCLSMNGSNTIAPTRFVAGWNRPGFLPEIEPEAFASIKEAAEYIAEELELVYETDLNAPGGQSYYTPMRVAEALESLHDVREGDTEWSSGEAFGGYVYWIAPEPVTPD